MSSAQDHALPIDALYLLQLSTDTKQSCFFGTRQVRKVSDIRIAVYLLGLITCAHAVQASLKGGLFRQQQSCFQISAVHFVASLHRLRKLSVRASITKLFHVAGSHFCINGSDRVSPRRIHFKLLVCHSETDIIVAYAKSWSDYPTQLGAVQSFLPARATSKTAATGFTPQLLIMRSCLRFRKFALILLESGSNTPSFALRRPISVSAQSQAGTNKLATPFSVA